MWVVLHHDCGAIEDVGPGRCSPLARCLHAFTPSATRVRTRDNFVKVKSCSLRLSVKASTVVIWISVLRLQIVATSGEIFPSGLGEEILPDGPGRNENGVFKSTHAVSLYNNKLQILSHRFSIPNNIYLLWGFSRIESVPL